MSGNLWLYDIIAEAEGGHYQPNFARQSMINWMLAIKHEIHDEYGRDIVNQFISSNETLKEEVKPIRHSPELSCIFEPLFYSFTYAQSLRSSSICIENDRVWMQPSNIIEWYYSIFNAVKSMLASYDGRITKTHSGLVRAFSDTGIRSIMPHPLNLVAIHEGTKLEYLPTLPKYPEMERISPARKFYGTKVQSCGFILSYLSGTCEWVITEKKKNHSSEMMKNFSTTDCRSKNPRKFLCSKLPHEVNFLTCAYRYRGKVNYRDGLFLTYGEELSSYQDIASHREYIEALTVSATFFFICSLSYIRARLGNSFIKIFLEDIDRNLIGKEEALENEFLYGDILENL